MAKPWEKPDFLKPRFEVRIPTDLNGVLEIVLHQLDVLEWQRTEWKRLYPGNESAIDDEIDRRILRLSNIRKYVEGCLVAYANEPKELACIFDLINCGFTLQHEVYSWSMHMAERGISQELGQHKSKQARGVTQQEWIERKQQATSSMKEHNNNKIKVAKSLGIKPSTLENWLRGGRREKK